MSSLARGFNLGDAHGRIIIDASGVHDAVRTAQNAFTTGISAISQGLQGLGDGITGLGATIGKLAGPAVALEALGIKVAASFQDVMKQIEVFGGVTGTELEQVRQFVLKLGADTVFSAEDAGNAMLDLLKSGMTLAEAMDAVPVVLQLATVGNLSLATSAGIVTSALAQFGLRAGDASKVSNALAQAANASRADVSDLGQALANVGPIAHAYGLSIEDTAAIMGVFANNGIMGAEAGTQLRSMLLNLSRPTDAVQAAMKKLGVSLYDAQGNTRDFNAFLLDLDTALDKLPIDEQNTLMYELAGTYGITGLNALRASGGIDKMRKAMKDAPSAAAVADASLGTMNRTMESLSGSVEALETEALTPFMDNVLRPLAEQAIQIVNRITDWARANPELTTTIAALVAGAVGLAAVLVTVGQIVGVIGVLFGVLASPIVLLVAAIAALAVAFATNFGGIRDLLTGLFEAIRAKVEPVLTLIRDWFINDALPKIVAFVQGTVLPAIQSFFAFLGRVWEIVGPVLGQLADWFIKTALPAVLNFVSGTVIPGIQNFINTLMGIWDKVQPVLYNLLQWFVQKGLPDIISGLQWFKEHVLDPVIDLLSRLWEFVKPALEALAKWFITDGLPGIISIAKELYEKVLTPIVELLRDLWTKYAEPALAALGKWFSEEAPKVGKWIQDNIIVHLNELIETVKKIIDWVGQAIAKLREFLGLSNITTGSGSGNNPWDPFHDYPGPYNANQMYLVGKSAQPEAFISKSDGYAIPNFDKLLAGLGGGNSGPVFQAGSVVIQANSRSEGEAAADGFGARLTELLGRRG